MTKKFRKNKFIIEQLEQRLMFSADFEPLPLDGKLHENILVGSSVEEMPLVPTASEIRGTEGKEELRREILFIDKSIPDYQQLADDLLKKSGDGRQIDVVLLDISRNGIIQISETLGRYQNLDAVHVISHGTDGTIQLGNARLTQDSLDSYADSIEKWGRALNSNADLLFYGCNIAAGDDGRELMQSLTFLTGADVAASNDVTGNSLMGGDWNLEYSTGDIETDVALSAEMQESWTGVLAVVASDDFSTGYTGGSGWTGNWTEINEADGAGSGRISAIGGTLELSAAYNDSGNPANYKGAYRQVDLSGAPSTATLTFDYQRFSDATGGTVYVDVGYGGGNWRTLTTYDLSSSDGSPVSSGNLTINSVETAADTQIRFRVSGPDGGAYIRIDNLQIDAAPGSTISGRVFEDADFAGTATAWDGGVVDAGLQNVEVELYTNAGAYVKDADAQTAADGTFTISGVADGTYKVRVRSATIADANTAPAGGLTGGTNPLPEMTWGNGSALYGGQAATVDDTATGDNAGVGDTWVTVTVSGGNVTGVDLGFAHNLIVNTEDAGQGSLRQFIINAENIGTANGTTANSSQFRMQVPTNMNAGADNWWRITTATALPSITDDSTTLDASTQRINSGVDSNTRGPEIEIFGNNITANGIEVIGTTDVTINGLVINSFDGGLPDGNGIFVNNATNTTITGCYIGTDAIASVALENASSGIHVSGTSTGTVIGGPSAGEGNIISGSSSRYGIDVGGTSTNTTIKGNTIGTGYTGLENLSNRTGIMVFGSAPTTNNVIGGVNAGEGNLVANSTFEGIYMSASGTGDSIQGNTIRDSGSSGISSKVDGVLIAKNVIYSNNGAGIALGAGGTNNKVYQNTIHGNTGGAADGIRVNDTGAIIKNNIITGNGRYGINLNGGSMTEEYNLVTDSVTGPANVSGQSNVALDASDLNAAPQYVDAAGGDFTLISGSLAINAGVDLGVDQPDMNGADPGNFSGSAPEMGAHEYTATHVYYSVGQNTADHKTGTPTVTISGGMATFSVAQTAANMGVGDRVTNDGGSIAYISEKISDTQWSLVTATGGSVTDELVPVNVDSIAHEFASLFDAEAGAADINHLNSSDLVAGDYVLNLACYYDTGADTTAVDVDGWTTGVNNYIRIYTPTDITTEVNQSQRHAGVWNTTGAYRMEVSNDTGIHVNVTNPNRHVRIEGLQIYVTSTNAQDQAAVYFWTNGGGSGAVDERVSNNIFRGSSSTWNWHSGINTDDTTSFSGTGSFYNNIIYGFKGTGNNQGIITVSGGVNYYVYNNTIYDSATGITSMSSSSIVAINNLIDASVTQAASGTFLAGTDYNATNDASIGYTVTGGGNTNDRTSQTFTFVNEGARDLHLAGSDTGALNVGTDLSGDPNLAFITDLEGESRPYNASWDIGADEHTSTHVYYSVGQNTNDHKTGTPDVTISDGVATFSVAQTATNMGVGDRVTYNGGSVAYISGKISDTQWTLVTATGQAPTDELTPVTVNSIAHEFASLFAAEAGAADINHLNTTDLVAGDYVLNLACYYDTGADTTNVIVDGYTTGVNNYINIYTPTDTSTEVNQSQRHDGKYNAGSYVLQQSTGVVMSIQDNHVRVEGLQVRSTSNAGSNYGICVTNDIVGAGDIRLSHNYIEGSNNTTGNAKGIYVYNGVDATLNVDIWNNIIYNVGASGGATQGIIILDTDVTGNVYNNTQYKSNAFWVESTNIIAKNNILSGGWYIGAGYSASSTNNAGTHGTPPGTNPITLSSTDPLDYFISASDLHINSGATFAAEIIDAGIDPSGGFSDDIDGNSRPFGAGWDIGADELISDTISGTVYTDEGTTNIGAGKTVRLLVNGTSAGTAVTNASGQYSISANVSAGDALLVYVDENDGSSNDATTVTVSDGNDLANLNIYVDHLITRNDNGGSLTNALLSTAKGAYSDAEIIYSVSAGDLTANTADTEVYIPFGYTFAPGGNITADSVEVLGTFTGAADTYNIAAHWNAATGTFTANNALLSFVCRPGYPGNLQFTPGTSNYYDVSIDTNDKFMDLMGDLTVTNNLTLKSSASGSGTLDIRGRTISTKNFIWQSGYIWHTGGDNISCSGDLTDTGGTFFAGNGSGLTITFNGNTDSVFNPDNDVWGTIVVNKTSQNNTVTLSTNNLTLADGSLLDITSGIFDIAGNNLNIGVGSTFSNTGTFRLQGGETVTNLTNDVDSGTVVYNGGASYTGLIVGNTYSNLTFNGTGTWTLDAALDVDGNMTITNGTVDVDNVGNHQINVAGNWSNSDTFIAQSGTVVFDGGDQIINGSTTFNNFTKVESTNDATDVTLTFDNTATQTINGTITLDGLDADDRINLVSDIPTNQWSINLTASATKGTMDYLDVTDSDASGSDVSQITIDPANSIDGGNNDCWFNSAPTDISISASTIDENVDTSGGSSIGTLSSSDPDSGDTFTYTLVGGADLGNFSIGGAGSDELILTAGILNYEAKSSYEVIVRTTDAGGLTFDKTITVTVNDLNEDPTDVSISASTIDENVDTSGGSTIGTLSSSDPDSGDTFTYTLVGGADQGSFSIGGAGSDELVLTAGILNFEVKSSYEVIVRTTDSGGLTFDKTITVTINDLNEDPTDVSISASTIDENVDTSGGSSIGTLSSSDPDSGDTFTYTLVGGADLGNFSIGGAGSDELILTAGILNYEAKSSQDLMS